MTIAFSLLFLGTESSNAQSDSKVKKTPEEIAQKITDNINKNLSLSEEQYKKIYELTLDKISKRINEKEKYNSLDKETRKQMKKNDRAEFRKSMESILTKEQIDKCRSLKSDRIKEKNKQKKNKE